MRALGAFSLFFFAWIAKTETNYRKSVTQPLLLKELFWNLTFSLHFGVHFAVSSRLAISLLKFGFLGAHVSAFRLRAHKAACELVHFFSSTLLYSVGMYIFSFTVIIYEKGDQQTDRKTGRDTAYMGNNFLLPPPHFLNPQRPPLPPPPTIYKSSSGSEHYRFAKNVFVLHTTSIYTKKI